jgi:hypothetical protein
VVARDVAGQIARLVNGVVMLTFFDTEPREYDVTGKEMKQIEEITKHVVAQGGTSIGCGMAAATARMQPYDGIVVVSDGGHNTAPRFSTQYHIYGQRTGLTPTVVYFRLRGEPDIFDRELEDAGIAHTTVDIDVYDGYALPNLAQLVRHRAYSLVQEIMETPLLTLSRVLRAA